MCICRVIIVPDLLTFILNFQVRTTWQGSQKHPSAIIIGIQKGGTRALIEFLRNHPMIKAPVDEQNFFCDDSIYDASDYTYSKQLRKMPLSMPNQITVEKSPNSFKKSKTPQKLSKYQKFLGRDLKLILTVIPPIKRAVSHYFHVRSRPWKGSPIISPNLTEALLKPGNKFVDGSMFGKYLPEWLKYFYRDQILIVNGTKLALENPGKTLQEVESFLGLERFLTEDKFYLNAEKGFYCYNRVIVGCMWSDKGHIVRPQNLTPLAEEVLKAKFEPDLKQFYKLTNIALPALWNYLITISMIKLVRRKQLS